MKRCIVRILGLSLLLGLLTGCQANSTPTAAVSPVETPDEILSASQCVVPVEILEVENASALVLREDGALFFISLDALSIYDNAGQAADASILVPGMQGEVVTNGDVLETYPLMYGSVFSLTVTSQQPDAIGFYRQLCADLCAEDPALMDGVEMVYLDLSNQGSDLPALSSGEQDALYHLLSRDFGMEVYSGGYAVVKEAGLLEEDGMYFPNGVIITLTDNDDGTFQAQLWRSGLGAIFWTDCTTFLLDSQWSYELGAWAIS